MRALIIGYVWPEPNSSAAGRRILDIIAILQELDAEVTFASAAVLGEHSIDLAAINVDAVSITLNCSSFDQFIGQLQPDIVVFDRFLMEEQFAWRLERSCPGALRVLDSEDLHCLRHARHQALKQQRKMLASDLMCDLAVREIASIWRCDLSLIISEFEISLLKEFFGVDAGVLHYLPLLSKFKAEDQQQWPDFEQRKHLLLLGNFRHAPNWDAVQYLRSAIWPQIRQQLPDVECHVYGAYPPPKALQLHSDKLGFLVKGWAADATVVQRQSRLCLAPLRFGAGQKGKLLEAMENGTPSVCSEIGAEAMSSGLSWPGRVVADSENFASDFVKACCHLYTDQNDWRLAQQQGLETLQRGFDRQTYGDNLKMRLAELQWDVEGHRLKHFNGLMLRHHSLKSHQYMSQWIEAKNTLADKG
ncbi:MAG: hypothetical protein ACI9BO_000437 [Zhongshania sp.]